MTSTCSARSTSVLWFIRPTRLVPWDWIIPSGVRLVSLMTNRTELETGGGFFARTGKVQVGGWHWRLLEACIQTKLECKTEI